MSSMRVGGPEAPLFADFRSKISLPFLAGLIFLLLAQVSFADGGAVLAMQTSGPYRITLFGSPAPLRAGFVDLSVFVQNAKTGAPILDPKVTVELKAASKSSSEAWVPPCCSMKSSTRPVAATHAAAQNKLLYAANLMIPATGSHQVLVRLDEDSAPLLTATVEVSPALPPATTFWPCLAFPPLIIVGFALNQRLRRRPHENSSRNLGPKDQNLLDVR